MFVGAIVVDFLAGAVFGYRLIIHATNPGDCLCFKGQGAAALEATPPRHSVGITWKCGLRESVGHGCYFFLNVPFDRSQCSRELISQMSLQTDEIGRVFRCMRAELDCYETKATQFNSEGTASKSDAQVDREADVLTAHLWSIVELYRDSNSLLPLMTQERIARLESNLSYPPSVDSGVEVVRLACVMSEAFRFAFEWASEAKDKVGGPAPNTKQAIWKTPFDRILEVIGDIEQTGANEPSAKWMEVFASVGLPSEKLIIARECLKAVELDDRYAHYTKRDFAHAPSTILDDERTEVTIAGCVMAKLFAFAPDECANGDDLWREFFPKRDDVGYSLCSNLHAVDLLSMGQVRDAFQTLIDPDETFETFRYCYPAAHRIGMKLDRDMPDHGDNPEHYHSALNELIADLEDYNR